MALLSEVRSLREILDAHLNQRELMDAVASIYSELAREVEATSPKCEASGRCCKFETFGHRLYVTTAELAVFTSLLRPPALSAAGRSPRSLPMYVGRDGCPFQVENLCSVHTIRPFGCRIFYCDPAAEPWMTAAYERFHSQIVELHRRFEIEYRYVEWRQALTELEIPLPDP